MAVDEAARKRFALRAMREAMKVFEAVIDEEPKGYWRIWELIGREMSLTSMQLNRERKRK